MSRARSASSGDSRVDIKVVVLGMTEAGKTCLVQKFLTGKFFEQAPPVMFQNVSFV